MIPDLKNKKILGLGCGFVGKNVNVSLETEQVKWLELITQKRCLRLQDKKIVIQG